jgi:hypothetical protein
MVSDLEVGDERSGTAWKVLMVVRIRVVVI